MSTFKTSTSDRTTNLLPQLDENGLLTRKVLNSEVNHIPIFDVLNKTEDEWRQEPVNENLLRVLKSNDLPYPEGITKGEALDSLEQFDQTRDESMYGKTMPLGMVANNIINGVTFDSEFISLSDPEQNYEDLALQK